MNNTTVNLIVIVGTMIIVLVGGLSIFLWWRSKYGVWAQEREARQEQITRRGTVVGNDWSTTNDAVIPASPGNVDPAIDQRRAFLTGASLGVAGAMAAEALAHHHSANDSPSRPQQSNAELDAAGWSSASTTDSTGSFSSSDTSGTGGGGDSASFGDSSGDSSSSDGSSSDSSSSSD